MSCTRSKLVAQAQSWLGLNEADGSFKVIIDTYNSHKPLARGYKLKYTDAWCSGFASACAIACNATDIIPTEVGCGKHIDLFKKMGIWVENDAYVPAPGDYIFYNWKDDGEGDCTSGASHVGIVEKVEDGFIHVIEGNKSEAVGSRFILVNSRYIRGFGVPKYDAEKEDVPEVKAKESAKSFLRTLSGTYKVTAKSGLNIRHGAGITKKRMVTIPYGTKVNCYGYYTSVLGVKWLSIKFTYNGVTYQGFASSEYLQK